MIYHLEAIILGRILWAHARTSSTLFEGRTGCLIKVMGGDMIWLVFVLVCEVVG